jgi:hypothetical protein
MPTLPPNAPESAVAHRLLQLTQGALARQALMQIASIPDAASGPAWMFEAPLATPQGTAVAQFQISRDAPEEQRRHGKDAAAPVWRARFSLDIEPLGPVHAQVILSGEDASVQLWAERSDTAGLLHADRSELTSALRKAGFEPEVAVSGGAPRSSPAPGRFLDQAS